MFLYQFFFVEVVGGMLIRQGRVWAGDPGEAAEKIRGQYGEGRLVIKKPFSRLAWYEFTIVLERSPTGWLHEA